MKEFQRHHEAFELYFSYLQSKKTKSESIIGVASEYNVANSTMWRWHKEFNWDERAHLRNIEINKQVEKKINNTLVNNKAKYLTFIHKLMDDWKRKVDKGEVPVEIKSASDVDKIVKLALLLQDEAGEIIENQISVNMEKGLERLRRIEAQHKNSTNNNKSNNKQELIDPGTINR